MQLPDMEHALEPNKDTKGTRQRHEEAVLLPRVQTVRSCAAISTHPCVPTVIASTRGPIKHMSGRSFSAAVVSLWVQILTLLLTISVILTSSVPPFSQL